ncbi:MAG: L-threonylcarbamoyladenylate synthase, partial [Cyclobacteriaceae bacterium]|nr:L-threonylcarbamoyladenylate synthase [Cyclobacteriaceae bacterium]
MTKIGKNIELAASLLQKGEVVAIPTETVYGLAANAFNSKAVAQIFEVKNRPAFDPLIVHIGDRSMLKKIVRKIPVRAEKLMDEFWPGPLTLVLEKDSSVPDIVTSGLPTVGVRMPAHSVSLSLLQSLDFPLAAPSANPFGFVSPTTPEHVSSQLGDKIPYILDGGDCSVGIESTIVGFEGDDVIVYRLGGLSVEEIEAVTGKVEIRISSSSPKAPGMLIKHYSPGKPLFRGDVKSVFEKNPDKIIGVISFSTIYDFAIKDHLY